MVFQTVSFDSQHEDLLHDAQFDYYGKRLATCSSDRTIKVFEVDGESHMLIDTLKGHDGPVWCVTWAHPKFDSILASASYDGRVILWKESQGRYVKIYEYTKHSGSVNAIAWAPHTYGLSLAVGASDGHVSLLTYVEQQQQWETVKWTAHTIGVNAVAWSPTTTHPECAWILASGGCDHTIKLWQVPRVGGGATSAATGQPQTEPECVAELRGHEDWVRDLSFAPNLGIPTTYLASCGQDKCVYMWTASQTQKPLQYTKKKVGQFQHVVWRVSWSLSGDRLAIASGDNKVSIWRETVDGEWECVNTIEE